QDPRYFRRGPEYGGVGKRALYAASRVFVTRTDRGSWTFNSSELVGRVAGSGLANAYYPHERTLGDNAERVSTQFVVDALSNILKEFWPDFKNRGRKKKKP